MQILYTHSELVWNCEWHLIKSKLDDGVQFVKWQYCGTPTNGVWMDAVAVPFLVVHEYSKFLIDN